MKIFKEGFYTVTFITDENFREFERCELFFVLLLKLKDLTPKKKIIKLEKNLSFVTSYEYFSRIFYRLWHCYIYNWEKFQSVLRTRTKKNLKWKKKKHTNNKILVTSTLTTKYQYFFENFFFKNMNPYTIALEV